MENFHFYVTKTTKTTVKSVKYYNIKIKTKASVRIFYTFEKTLLSYQYELFRKLAALKTPHVVILCYFANDTATINFIDSNLFSNLSDYRMLLK
jgi:hypothetical protein